jgi:hypothetical protein
MENDMVDFNQREMAIGAAMEAGLTDEEADEAYEMFGSSLEEQLEEELD